MAQVEAVSILHADALTLALLGFVHTLIYLGVVVWVYSVLGDDSSVVVRFAIRRARLLTPFAQDSPDCRVRVGSDRSHHARPRWLPLRIRPANPSIGPVSQLVNKRRRERSCFSLQVVVLAVHRLSCVPTNDF
jgi:hypothetical protein